MFLRKCGNMDNAIEKSEVQLFIDLKYCILLLSYSKSVVKGEFFIFRKN